ncbi:A/G-specific adenine glycosylase [Devosia algicola]|uniref:Adenine DNA glycosylase n=1 Tax=Devosia algicola TaxID=3026418 RepID=A0ABY7YU40_9HYPH|nr:A/G-specific adenine glycosylase [Devosia algicola]WDR04365.1 A/G-specific adenine glycosylase [Devosia algicola]
MDSAAVLRWYDRYARDLAWRTGPAERARGDAPDPYRVWLSEVMLQQTTVATVGRYFARFTSLWPTVFDLAAAPLDAVLVEWAGLGYYARARNLHACAVAVVEHHDGVFPKTSNALQALPGIGAYTSAAIAAICHDEPIAVLDGNLDRVLARYYRLDVPVREAKETLRAALQTVIPARAGDFAQAMMDIGATICTPRKALCTSCPLRSGCLARTTENPTLFPIKAQKTERPTRYGHAFVMFDGDGDIFLETRPDKGLLAKMTQTPTSEWTARPSDPRFPCPGYWQPHGRIVHVFTHFRLELEVWSIKLVDAAALEHGWWADPRAFGREALPTLFRKVLAQSGLA